MAGKAGGRLTFSGRQEYEIRRVRMGDAIVGCAVICPCELGDHHLAVDEHGVLIERAVTTDWPYPYLFSTYADAQAAIEAWQRRHDAAQRASGESEGTH